MISEVWIKNLAEARLTSGRWSIKAGANSFDYDAYAAFVELRKLLRTNIDQFNRFASQERQIQVIELEPQDPLRPQLAPRNLDLMISGCRARVEMQGRCLIVSLSILVDFQHMVRENVKFNLVERILGGIFWRARAGSEYDEEMLCMMILENLVRLWVTNHDQVEEHQSPIEKDRISENFL